MNEFCKGIAQKIKDELSNPDFYRLLEISDEIGKLIFKLERKYDLPDTGKAAISWNSDECTMMLLDYIQQLIPDAPEIPELEALIKEEILLRRKYKESKGMPTVTN